jgi:hypothetical protein
MKFIFLLILSFFFEVEVFAQNESTDVESKPLKIAIGSNKDTKIAMINPDVRLFEVPKKNWFEFWTRHYQITRLNPTTFELVFANKIHLAQLSNGEIKTYALEKIRATLPEDQLDLMMNLDAGSLVTDADGSTKKAEEFVDLMKQQGFSQKMFEHYNEFVPMRVLEIKQMDLEFDIDELLSSKKLPEARVNYEAKLIVPSMFRNKLIKQVPIALNSIGEVLKKGPLLDSYISAFQDLINRYYRLQNLGWHKAFIDITLEKRLDDAKKSSSNLVPLSTSLKCSAVFKKMR